MSSVFIIAVLFAIFKFKTENPSNEEYYKEKAVEVFHAHYTAGKIEDAIREIRKEDYPLRQKYYELKGNKL